MLNKKYLVVLLVIMTAALLHAQQVIKPGNLSGSIQQQFENSFNNGKPGGNFWIGYSIMRNDDRGIFIGSYYYDDYANVSLRDIIMNNRDYKDYTSKHGVDRRKRYSGRSFQINNRISVNDGEIPDRETAILLRYNEDSKNINDFAEIGVCSMSHNFDFNSYPLTWLGKTDNKNSAGFLFGLYKKASTLREQKDLVGAISIHSGQPAVTNFLVNILRSKDDNELRKDVAFWLGIQNNNDALSALKNAVNDDPVTGVRKNAVYGIGYMELPGIIDELVNIARHNSVKDVRKSAVYALGNRAVKKAEEELKNFIENDPDIEIKKAAVYALANNSEDCVPYLVKIAKTNPSVEIRKCAIYSLSNSDDERALDALIELAKN